jgi:predicted metal-dependent hydrolase
MANLSLRRNDKIINSDWILKIQFANGAIRQIGCRNRKDLIAKAKAAKAAKAITHVWANDFKVK